LTIWATLFWPSNATTIPISLHGASRGWARVPPDFSCGIAGFYTNALALGEGRDSQGSGQDLLARFRSTGSLSYDLDWTGKNGDSRGFGINLTRIQGNDFYIGATNPPASQSNALWSCSREPPLTILQTANHQPKPPPTCRFFLPWRYRVL